MTDETGPLHERGTVTMRIVSPCEHGNEITDTPGLADGTLGFSSPCCRDSKGNPRYHSVTPEKYPNTVRRR